MAFGEISWDFSCSSYSSFFRLTWTTLAEAAAAAAAMVDTRHGDRTDGEQQGGLERGRSSEIIPRSSLPKKSAAKWPANPPAPSDSDKKRPEMLLSGCLYPKLAKPDHPTGRPLTRRSARLLALTRGRTRLGHAPPMHASCSRLFFIEVSAPLAGLSLGRCLKEKKASNGDGGCSEDCSCGQPYRRAQRSSRRSSLFPGARISPVQARKESETRLLGRRHGIFLLLLSSEAGRQQPPRSVCSDSSFFWVSPSYHDRKT